VASRRHPPARKTVRCAVYTRQSVARPDVDPTLSSCELQAQRCLAFIEQRAAAGWRFVERFDDEGESGATMERDGLFELLLAVEARDVDHLVVHRVDRLSRKLVDLAQLLNFFKHFDVEVSFVDGALASMGGAMTRLQVSVLGSFAEFEHSIISERLRDAHGSRREQGLRSAGRLPFGYRSNRDTKQLVPYPPDAAFVRECFERAAAGVLPAVLAADGARRAAQAKWSARAVIRMLRNPVYAGRLPGGAASTHEAIVSAELFERVAVAITGRRTKRTAPRRLGVEEDPFILRGILKCHRCRKAMVPAANVPMRHLSSRTPRYYRCRTLGCDGEPLTAADVEARVVSYLATLPASFSSGHRSLGKRNAGIWHLLTHTNQRGALEALFTFLAWDPTTGRFVAEATNFDWDAHGHAEPPPSPPRPPPPMTFRELLAQLNGRT
jgi:DNA invertase Pin-like site-specific DNA recombinase